VASALNITLCILTLQLNDSTQFNHLWHLAEHRWKKELHDRIEHRSARRTEQFLDQELGDTTIDHLIALSGRLFCC